MSATATVVKGICLEHSGTCANIQNINNEIKDIWQVINGIRGWIVAGMASIILFCLSGLGFLACKLLGWT